MVSDYGLRLMFEEALKDTCLSPSENPGLHAMEICDSDDHT